MNLAGIIAISGKPGLYKVVKQGKNNLFVQSLDSDKITPAYSSDKISALEDISVYTYEEDIPLIELIQKIAEKAKYQQTLSHKEDKKKLESYFEEIVPNYDRERVYFSDIKKIIQWYNQLQVVGIVVASEIRKEEVANLEEIVVSENSETPKAKKTRAKKTEKVTE
jgi:hypothetical protein